MKDPTTSASSLWPRAAILYFFVLFPLSFLLPGYLAWENGPIEMSQNMILLTGVIWSLYHYTQETHLHRPSYWLFAASFFLLLFGREISWGRVFLLKEITETGPVFWSMKDLPYHRVINGAIGLLTAVVIHLFYQSVNVQKTLHCLKKNRLMFLLTVLAAILTLMGDKGQLFHDFRDETMEELSELFVYLQIFFFIHRYRIA
ncbi:MAG: hypothetical protein SOU94_04430 [Acidaminococcus sp.]|uniref:Uncharacterized protein n=1 Tax=Acidaminococcus intestini TaxID=187327 RepID=A0A943I633_9FIRM|nr:hypothetical protein [Acidaminococcus sp.]MBS5520283.1 hypothetical protein [Acidaminococcus intestini]MDY2739060.1 hypothetical protein [Acidaminococcus sp.]